MSKEAKDRVNHYIRQNSRIVKGVFRNHYTPGHALKIPHRAGRGPIKIYELEDGKTSEIPLSLARHLNHHCYEPEYEDTINVGESAMIRGKQRYSFESLDFLTDDLDQPINAG